MAWLEIGIEAGREAINPIGMLLVTLGYDGGIIIEEQTGAGRDIDPRREVTIQIAVEQGEAGGTLASRLERGLELLRPQQLIGDLRIREADQDKWAAAFRAAYRIQRIGERVVVVPAWESYEPMPDDLQIKLDPGRTFGTGLHPATRLSVQLLERYARPGMKALDLGSGSGILSVLMAKIGLDVLALDNDQASVAATRMNVELNELGDRVTVQEGSLGAGADLGHWMGWQAAEQTARVEDRAAFDLIAANLLARVHVALAPDYRQALRAGEGQTGLLLAAGITTRHEVEAAGALEQAGFEPIERRQDDEWVAFMYRVKRTD